MPSPAGVARWLIPAAGLGLLLALCWQIGPARIAALLWSAGLKVFVLAGLYAVHECVRAVAVRYCLPAGIRPSLPQLLWIRFVGEAVRTLTHTGPFVSEPARAWLIGRDRDGGSKAWASVLAEIILNSATSSLFMATALGGALLLVPLPPPVVTLARVLATVSLVYVTLVIGCCVARVRIIGAIVRWLGTVPWLGPRMQVRDETLDSLETGLLEVLSRRPARLSGLILLECLCQALLVAELMLALRFMGLPVTLGTAMIIEGLTKVANLVQLFGATEGGFALVLAWLELGAAAGVTLALIKRVRSAIVAGLGLLLLLPFRRRGSATSADVATGRTGTVRPCGR